MKRKYKLFSLLGLFVVLAIGSCTLPKKIIVEAQKDDQNIISTNVTPPIESSKIKNLPIIRTSNIISALQDVKTKNPQISTRELADLGNKLAETKGFNYTFENCGLAKQKVDFSLQSDISNLFYNYKAVDLNGKKVEFKIKANKFDFEHPCFCLIDIPTLKVNTQTITVIADGKPFEIKHSKDFYLEEFVLVDATLKKEIRKWFVPIDSTPLGISADGKKVYVEFDFADNQYQQSLQVDGLAIEVSEIGDLKFVSADDAVILKGKELEGYPKVGESSYRVFKKGSQEFIIKFSYPCT